MHLQQDKGNTQHQQESTGVGDPKMPYGTANLEAAIAG